MAIIRIKKTENYTVMSNHHFKNRNLSLKAKGLLSMMLSLPNKWEYTIEGLATMVSDGKDSIRSAIKELESEGYLIRSREIDDKGRLGKAIYDVYEIPMSENPTLENPTLGNPTQLNTNKLNTNKHISISKPTLEEVKAYILEKGLSVDANQFYDYFETGNWVDSKGNKVKNWKQKLLTWNKYDSGTGDDIKGTWHTNNRDRGKAQSNNSTDGVGDSNATESARYAERIRRAFEEKADWDD